MRDRIYRIQTRKSSSQFALDFKEVAARSGFLVHNEDTMDMAQTFGKHGVELAAGFDLHMIQVCKPDKAAKSLQANPERAILMPKFVMAFTQEGITEIRFFSYSRDVICSLVEDEDFADSLEQSYATIRILITEAVQR